MLGPDFGSPPSYTRRKLLTVLSDCGKSSSFIDDISIIKRYASETSHAFPVSSDDEALTKALKEVAHRILSELLLVFCLSSFKCSEYSWLQVKNDRSHFIWTQFSELNSYYKMRVEDEEKFNGTLAEMISLLTCQKKSVNKKAVKCKMTSELKEILTRMNARVRCLYSALPTNTMLIICTGHGDTAIVHKYVFLLIETNCCN